MIEDSINRQEAIKAVIEHGDGIDHQVEKLEVLPATKLWRSVMDGLPAESGDYLVAHANFFKSGKKVHTFQVTHYSAKYKAWNHYDDLDDDLKNTFDDVEFWLDIPEVPDE